MATHDLKLGPVSVLLTTTDEAAAQRIGKAIEKERKHLFQCDGMTASVVRSDRDSGVDKPAAFAEWVHAMTAATAKALIKASEASLSVVNILEAEKINPRKGGPRSSVIDAAEERIGELATAE